ncbi:MAG: ABC transporter substrate-binding protein [Pseudomonadota bacterium]
MTISRRRLLTSTAAIAGLASTGFGRRARGQSKDSFYQPTRLRLGLVPLLSSGPIFIAQARGLFDKVGLQIETQFFADSALAVPALVAGELDLCVCTSNAGVFNAMSRGASYKLFLDRGSEKPGSGSMHIVVSNAMYEAGLDTIEKMGMLSGKRIGIQAPGSIDQYLVGRGLQKTGVDPRTQVDWVQGLAYPDIIKAMGAGRLDGAQIPVPLALLAEKNQAGHIIGPSWTIEPDAQLACFAINGEVLRSKYSAAVRYAMAHIHAGRLFNAAAQSQDADIIRIMSEATKVPGDLIKQAAPRWTWFTEDGMPVVRSVLAQAKFWATEFSLVPKPLDEATVFDLTAVKEAVDRLSRENPFI